MKYRFGWAGVLALVALTTSQIQSWGLTNGVVVISTRSGSDALYRQISSSALYDADDFQGPGALSPGDAAMASLLQDYGYVTRLVPEWLLRWDASDPSGVYSFYIPDPTFWYGGGGGPTRPSDTNFNASAQLVIISGSGSSGDMPPPNTNGIPIMMGEHSCLGDVALGGQSSLFMYGNKSGNSGNDTGTAAGPDQYMLALQPNHPIMQGIPLDSQGRVKIWRDPYPEENAHLPTGVTKLNYKYSWTAVDINPGKATVAPGTTVIGVRFASTNRAVFAVMDAGGTLADTTAIPGPWNGYTAAPSRLVHLFVNEHGSGDARRAFNALTDIGRVIFIRASKWAMGETLTPYRPLGLIQVSLLNPTQIQLAWDGATNKNYKIVGSTTLTGPDNFSHWETVAQDIHGVAGPGLTTA
jgi:hypothetical protein